MRTLCHDWKGRALPRRAFVAAGLTGLAAACVGWVDPNEGRERAEAWAHWNAEHDDAYALDGVVRWMSAGERPACARSAIVPYRGTSLRYAGAVFVDPAFAQRLARFETVVAEVARATYGREPSRIRHYGAYNCRAVRTIHQLLSEHALGNAIDVLGFDFGAAAKSTPLPAPLPKALLYPFEVRVLRHWGKTQGIAAIHARFLATLTERLAERSDIFRSMFGPGHGGHDDHLHLDVSPWRWVDL
jgi:hypothetical protein